MSLGLFNCRLIQPARDQLFFFAGCLAAPVPVRASSVQSPCDASCSAPTSGRARNASCVFPSQEGFVLVFRGSEAPVGCRRVHPTDSPTNSPEDPPILPIDSAIEPIIHPTASFGAVCLICLIFPIPNDSGGPGGGHLWLFPVGKNLEVPHFKRVLRHLSVRPLTPSPVRFPAAAYPVCIGSAAIRRTMLPNNRRVRWLSASINQ